MTWAVAIDYPVLTDDRGVEYVEMPFVDFRTLPAGWAQCMTPSCGRSWNDDKSTSVTPVPAGRCPFEHDHDDDSLWGYDEGGEA